MRFQRGLLAEANLHSLYLMFNAVDGFENEIRQHIACFQGMINQYSDEYSEAELSAFIAIGSGYWDQLFPAARPKFLQDFPAMEFANRRAPHTPFDIFIHIRSDRSDVNHLVGTQVCNLFGDSIHLAEQVKGFRYLDGRDLMGFIDGSSNPHGAKRKAVALVGDEDPEFAGGSYVHIQRYRHAMEQWNELPNKVQENIIGRDKADDFELKNRHQPAFSHCRRTKVVDEEGQAVEILRQSMPYGTMRIQGQFFISCARSPRSFALLLKSMICGEDQYHYDRLLDYTRAETGAAFFAPSVDFLRQYIS
ncbi:Dyp-type peroxidase [Catenovulum sediminis]|uniref:Dyp-type peroxidase n=1 Tax=Catenovulum sediminis TaxID=1740262 RepID=A0ABV1RII2_9ALTE